MVEKRNLRDLSGVLRQHVRNYRINGNSRKSTYGRFVLKPRVFKDERGYFYESFNEKVFESLTGIKVNFIQDNQSYSSKGTLRGLHFQKGDAAQAKLVRVTRVLLMTLL